MLSRTATKSERTSSPQRLILGGMWAFAAVELNFGMDRDR